MADEKDFCCLVIHGFGGGRREVQPLVCHLNRNGIPAYSVVLKGHEAGIWGMCTATRQDWIMSVTEELAKLQQQYHRVAVIGFSMGGLAATYAAEMNPVAMVFINVPIYFWDVRRILHNLHHDFKKSCRVYVFENMRKPPQSLYQFLRFLGETKERGFLRVCCPALVLQSLDDDTVQSRSADYIYKRLIHDKKQIRFYASGGHDILNSKTSMAVCCDVFQFLSTVRGEQAGMSKE